MWRSLQWAAAGTLFTCFMTALGAASVFFLPAGKRETGRLMGFAAGVMTAASVWSLLLPAIDRAESLGMAAWLPAAGGTAAGAAFLALLEGRLQCLREREGAMLFCAVTLHNIPEGMAVGLACALAARGEGAAGAAAALAFGVGVQNFPEGAAVALPLAGDGRRKGFARGVLSGVVEPLFGLGAVVFAAAAEGAMPWLLGFAAGAMLYVSAEELIPRARGRSGALSYIGGFLLMMVLDVALG